VAHELRDTLWQNTDGNMRQLMTLLYLLS
jgi:hypothetical protein